MRVPPATSGAQLRGSAARGRWCGGGGVGAVVWECGGGGVGAVVWAVGAVIGLGSALTTCRREPAASCARPPVRRSRSLARHARRCTECTTTCIWAG